MLATFGLAPSALIAEGPRSLIRPQCVRSGVALSAEAGARKVLWEPKPEVMEQTAMRRFQHVVRGGRGVEGSYEELWKWSVENSDAFWTTLLDFVQIEYSGSTTPAKEGEDSPAQHSPASVSAMGGASSARGLLTAHEVLRFGD